MFGTGLFLDQDGLGTGHPGFRGGDSDLEIGGIEFRQHLVLLKKSAVFEGLVDLDEIPGDLWRDGGGVVGTDAALAIQQHGEIAALKFEDLGFEDLGWHGLRLRCLHGNAHAPGREGTEGEDEDGDEQAEKHQEMVRGESAPETGDCQIRRRRAGFRRIGSAGRGFEIATKGEVEIDAVLQPFVAQPDQARAGVGGAALGLEDAEDIVVDTVGVVAGGLLFSQRGLLDLLDQEGLLLGERRIGTERRLNLAEGLERKLGVAVEQRLVRGESSAGVGRERAACIERLAFFE